MKKPLRILYLSFALPPGLRALHPEINPAGNAFESQMVAALRTQIEIRSVGLLPFAAHEIPADANADLGVTHSLLLPDRYPELWNRTLSFFQLKRQYRRWQATGWQPDVVMTYNLSPVYNAFIRWLRLQLNRPKLVVLLLDSTQLGKKLSRWKKFRYQLKPFAWLDEIMLSEFDACIGLSLGTEPHAKKRGLSFLWMPGACTPARIPDLKTLTEPAGGLLKFCYFGALAPHAGSMEMIRVFLSLPGKSELHICGYGKQTDEIAAIAQQSPRVKFHGLLPTPDDCLQLGRSCDVLINPRPAGYGNENNVASKLFDYALCGRAIIASRISGTDQVLGPEVFYFDPNDYENSLRETLTRVTNTGRKELNRRGDAIQKRILLEFSWARQGKRIAEFLDRFAGTGIETG